MTTRNTTKQHPHPTSSGESSTQPSSQPQTHNDPSSPPPPPHPNPNPPLSTQTPRIQDQYSISPVLTPSDLNAITSLFTQYAQSLNIDLTFQDFQSELSTLPGKYSPAQGGMLLLARNTLTGGAVGCIALRSLSSSFSTSTMSSTKSSSDDSNPETQTMPRTCELKRLYVHPSTRGTGLGKRLTRCMLLEAETMGYEEVKLDTLPTMKAAQGMYEKLGFRDVEAYCFNPIEGTRFLGLRLGKREDSVE